MPHLTLYDQLVDMVILDVHIWAGRGSQSVEIPNLHLVSPMTRDTCDALGTKSFSQKDMAWAPPSLNTLTVDN